MKIKSVILLIPILCSCGAGGGGSSGNDDNNILLYEKDPSYLFRGSFHLGIYDRPEAASIFDIQKEQKVPAPDEVRNDCICAAGSDIAPLVLDSEHKISIPLYDTSSPHKNVPLAYFTSFREGTIEGRKYTFLKRVNNDFYWELNNDERFFLFFTPAYQVTIPCFKNLIYTVEMKISFVYFDSEDLSSEGRHQLDTEFSCSSSYKTCFNNSIIEENLNLNLPNANVLDVYAPTLVIESISGTIDPVFINVSEEENISKYIRKVKLVSNFDNLTQELGLATNKLRVKKGTFRGKNINLLQIVPIFR